MNYEEQPSSIESSSKGSDCAKESFSILTSYSQRQQRYQRRHTDDSRLSRIKSQIELLEDFKYTKTYNEL